MDHTFWRSRQGTSEQQTTLEGHRVTTTTAGLFIPKDAAINGTRGDTGAATMALWFTNLLGDQPKPARMLWASPKSCRRRPGAGPRAVVPSRSLRVARGAASPASDFAMSRFAFWRLQRVLNCRR